MNKAKLCRNVFIIVFILTFIMGIMFKVTQPEETAKKGDYVLDEDNNVYDWPPDGFLQLKDYIFDFYIKSDDPLNEIYLYLHPLGNEEDFYEDYIDSTFNEGNFDTIASVSSDKYVAFADKWVVSVRCDTLTSEVNVEYEFTVTDSVESLNSLGLIMIIASIVFILITIGVYFMIKDK